MKPLVRLATEGTTSKAAVGSLEAMPALPLGAGCAAEAWVSQGFDKAYSKAQHAQSQLQPE